MVFTCFEVSRMVRRRTRRQKAELGSREEPATEEEGEVLETTKALQILASLVFSLLAHYSHLA